MKFKHLIVTKFNVNIRLKLSKEKQSIWMKDRIRLFKKYCLPSIKNQTCQNFEWLIFLDKETEYLDIFDYENIIIKRVDNVSNYWSEDHPIVETIRSYNNDIDYLITTRLDNDDCININMIDKVQKIIKSVNKPTVINFTGGCKINDNTGLAYNTNFRGPNPFISFIENTDNILTVYRDIHNRMKRYGKVLNIKDEMMCGMVCHNNNICNRFEASNKYINWNDIKHNFGG